MFNFPDLPAIGDVYAPVGGPAWQWDGDSWLSLIIMPVPPQPETMMAVQLGVGYSDGIFYDGAYTLMNSTSTQALIGDKLYFTPFRIRDRQFFNKIGFNISAPYTATKARVGIYDALMETSLQYPGKLIYDAGEVDVTVPGIVEAIIHDPMTGRGKELVPSEYWLGLVLNGECTIYGSVAPQGMYKFGSSMGPGMPIDLLFSQDYAFAALPDLPGLIAREAGVFLNMSLRMEAT
jgi:hypothetical protein